MNFQTIRETTEKDAKGYFIRLDMYGIVDSFTPVEFTKTGSRFQQVMITDTTGEQQKVKIWLGDDKTIGGGCIGRKLAFQIAKNPFKNQMYYGGFWNDRAVTAPAKPPARAAQTPPNQLSASTPCPNTPFNSFGAINEDWARCKVLCAILESMREQPVELPAWEDVYREVLQHIKFIREGEKYFIPEPHPSIQENPDYVGDDPQEPPNDGIPF